MKKYIVLIIISLASFSYLNAQNDVKSNEVEIIEDFKNLHRYQNFYLGGQPTLEQLNWLKSKNVKIIINLRSDDENNSFTGDAFNEQKTAQALGFEYHSLPIGGRDDYTPKNLQSFMKLLKDNNENVFVHCKGGGRVNYFFMAYLIEAKGYSINEAVKVGESLGYSLLLENLLGIEISMEELK
jgi:uncharacterized protein (TIGR01244 family)